MSTSFSCGDAAALVTYLYAEGSAEERESVAAHVAECTACAREVALLGGARRDLAAWTVPEAPLGFRVAHIPESVAVAPWWRQPLPAWMQAAAAAALFTGGLAFGAARGASPDPVAVVPVQNAAAAPVASQRDLAQLEERLRAELGQLRAERSAAVAARPREANRDEAVLARVQALISESEERQRRELALRTAQLAREVETQRRADLTQVQRTMGQMEGLTGAEMRRQREMLNYMINVSQRR